MRLILEKMNVFSTILYGYTQPLKHISLTLRIICVYLFFYGIAGVSLTENLGQEHMAYSWVMTLISSALLGWGLFHLTRMVYFDETLRTMKLEEVTALWRFGASLKTILYFTVFSLLLKYVQETSIGVFNAGNVKSSFWTIIGLLYACGMLSLMRYIAIVPAIQGRSYTFFYMIFHPGYLFKIIVLACFSYLPFYLLLYGTKLLRELRLGDVDYNVLGEQKHILDFMLHGSVDIIAFIIFSTALISTTRYFIVPESAYMMRKLREEDQNEIYNEMKPYIGEYGEGAVQNNQEEDLNDGKV